TRVTAAGDSINVLAGAGGARSLGAQLDNQGILAVSQPLGLSKPSAAHQNSGTIDLSNSDMTITQTGTTPSFTTTGTITIGGGHTLTVSGGAVNYNRGGHRGSRHPRPDEPAIEPRAALHPSAP